MAGAYTVLTTQPSYRFTPPNKLTPIKLVTAEAQPSGVVFYFQVVQADYGPTHVDLIATGLAGYVNKAAKVAGVSGLAMQEAVTPANQIGYEWVVGVESTSGNSDATLTLPYGYLFDKRFTDAVAKEVGSLDAVEGL